MTSKDWVLLVIAGGNRYPMNIVQLQKATFLLARTLTYTHLQVDTFYDFVPHDYGPYCQELSSDAGSLVQEGFLWLILIEGLSYQQYLITPRGQSIAAQLREPLAKEVTAYLDAVVQWVTSLSFRQLIAAIYKAYPEMQVKSVFRKE